MQSSFHRFNVWTRNFRKPREKNLRLRKYPDTCRRGLGLPVSRPLVERGTRRGKSESPPFPSLSLLFFPPNREPVHRLGLGRTLYTCRQGLGWTLSNDRLLLATAMPVYAHILQTVTAVNISPSLGPLTHMWRWTTREISQRKLSCCWMPYW